MTSNGKGEGVKHNVNVITACFSFEKHLLLSSTKGTTKNGIRLWYKPKAKGAIKRESIRSTKRGVVILKVSFIGWYIHSFKQWTIMFGILLIEIKFHEIQFM